MVMVMVSGYGYGYGYQLFLFIRFESYLKFQAKKNSTSKGAIKLVREKGLEPPRRKAPDPKSGASANSATPAYRLKL